jgi:alkylhydroperoxidase/carboxymuconolactone decarboxylase family protein YurZ
MARAPSPQAKKKAALPAFAGSVAKRYPRVWDAYTKLGEEVAAAGSLSERERRLVKLALAIGSSSEGATHAHARQGLAEGLSAEDVRHVCLLGITTLGYPASARALSWVDDVLDK